MNVSVIIPIYNVEQYIEECIASVAAQTYKDFDIIAINDCSTDSSLEILRECIDKYNIPKDRISIIDHERNRGISAARNTGILHSTAEYLYFLDSDDIITPDCLEKLVKASLQHGKSMDMVVGNYRIDGPELGCPHITVKRSWLNRKKYIKAYCKEKVYPMPWNRLVKRDFIIKHGLYFEEGLIHEDTLWNFQILQYIGNVGIVQDDTYIYRVRNNSIQSSQDFTKHFTANTYIIGKLSDIMFNSSLKWNRHVYNFVEEEKQRHLRDCLSSGNKHLVRKLYRAIRRHPHYMPKMAMLLFGYHKSMFKRIKRRDRHYNLDFENGLEFFSNIPTKNIVTSK